MLHTCPSSSQNITPYPSSLILPSSSSFRTRKSDRDFLLLALACNGRALEFLSGDCKKDMDLVLAAVTEWPVALRLADPELRRCKPFVLALLERRACKIQSSSFQAAALHLRADREIAWAAVQRHGYCLEFASSDLRADKALVLRAVQHWGGGQRVHARGQSDRMVAIRPEQIDAWFDLASTMVSECGWELAANHPEACLYHRSSPSGNGHLIKINVEEVFIEDAPALARELLVRPEVRAQFHEAGCKECWIDWKELVRSSDSKDDWPTVPLPTDCPEEGSSTYACFQENHGTGQEQMVIARGTGRPDYFQIIVAFTTPEDRWARWATPFFSLLTDTASIAIKSYLNRPGVKLVRQLNSKFYCILSLRSYNRGPPLLPSETDHVDGVKAITVTAGEDGDRQGLFAAIHGTAQNQGLRGLRVLGFTLFGPIPVRGAAREEAVRARFHQAFTFQKAAYRRGNGGTAAPSLVEDAPARFCERPDQPPSDWFPVPKVVVHKTFLELDEDVGPQSPVRKIKSEKVRMMFSV
eukprot:g17277.t1